MKHIKTLLVLLTLVLTLGACSAKKEAVIVKVGIIGESRAWTYVKEQAAKENITIEIVAFTDYPQPNAALNAGELDLNAFQHVIYLNKEIAAQNYKLTPIGKTIIAPMGLYSDKISTIAEVKDGDIVVIPDDVTNGGRAILLLEAQGLIEVDDAAGLIPGLKDITSNPKNLDIKEVAATNIPQLLPDVAFAAINSGVAEDAGFIPTEDAFVLEQVNLTSDNPYINVIVARTEDKDDEVLLRIVELFQTDEVKQIILDDYNGSQIPVW
ncbi:MAG: MetQ/NlpA family ABC transporter substrate-binding protein [Erysipelotrichaceae bacterium]